MAAKGGNEQSDLESEWVISVVPTNFKLKDYSC